MNTGEIMARCGVTCTGPFLALIPDDDQENAPEAAEFRLVGIRVQNTISYIRITCNTQRQTLRNKRPLCAASG
jgi:hypothetical protein